LGISALPKVRQAGAAQCAAPKISFWLFFFFAGEQAGTIFFDSDWEGFSPMSKPSKPVPLPKEKSKSRVTLLGGMGKKTSSRMIVPETPQASTEELPLLYCKGWWPSLLVFLISPSLLFPFSPFFLFFFFSLFFFLSSSDAFVLS
jgi:hypothetical protein